MKKLYTLLFPVLFVMPSFATGISGDAATCDTGALGSEDGSVAMRANYEPESIGLRWYDENKNLLTVNSASQSCTYGETITIPNPPTKTGYKFTGWKIINIFSTLDTTIAGSERWSKNLHNQQPYCRHGQDPNESTMEDCSGSVYTDLNEYEWKTNFSYGMVYGTSICTSVNGITQGTIGNPGNNTGQYCWCKVTGFVPNGNNTKFDSLTSSNWVFYRDRNNESDCKNLCAYGCSTRVQERNNTLRSAIFGQ